MPAATELTQDELMAFVDVMLWKTARFVDFRNDPDALRSAIELVVVDTWLMATDAVPFEKWMDEGQD